MQRFVRGAKSIRNYLVSRVAACPWSRKWLNVMYLRLTSAQRDHAHKEFSKIFKFNAVQGRDGIWEARFGDKIFRIPLSRASFWLDWDTALSVAGQDIEVRETYWAFINAPERPDLFIDIGANYGTHSLLFLAYQIETLSFEPNSVCHGYFERLCRANEVTPHIEPVALGAKQGHVTLSYPSGDTWLGSTNARVSERLTHLSQLITKDVEQRMLDDYISRMDHRRVLIKIDTEGHELAVLQGAGRTLQEIRPYIIFECWNNAPRNALFRFLAAKNYRVYELPWSPSNQDPSLNVSQFLASSAVNFIAAPIQDRSRAGGGWGVRNKP
ncbi:MAG: FkbM family methyltransferase [Anaerolineae bacterium]|nr:FkbM family methyltransferase [Anaerolineae bacterium]